MEDLNASRRKRGTEKGMIIESVCVHVEKGISHRLQYKTLCDQRDVVSNAEKQSRERVSRVIQIKSFEILKEWEIGRTISACK